MISTEGGHFPQIGDAQKQFLAEELARVRKNPGAVPLAVHHPPFSGDARHGGSPRMLKDIDDCVKQAGFAPHAVLSGHAHTRTSTSALRARKGAGKRRISWPAAAAMPMHEFFDVGAGRPASKSPADRCVVDLKTRKLVATPKFPGA